MRKLSADQIKFKKKYIADVCNVSDKLSFCISEFNERVKELYEEIIAPIEVEYNSVISEAKDFFEEIKSDAEDYIFYISDDKKEEYQEWINNMENSIICLQEIEIDKIPQLDIFSLFLDDLKNFPNSPSD